MSLSSGKHKKKEGKNEEPEGEEIHLAEQPCTECEPLPLLAGEEEGEGDPLVFHFQHSQSGVPVVNRSAHLRTFPNVFVGSDAVTWLQGHLQLSRQEAVERATLLMEEGVFGSVNSKSGGFRDSRTAFYRLAKHDVSERFHPANVAEDQTFVLHIHGFKGCPFCRRAIEAAEALQAERPDLFVVEAVEHENRVDFSAWLKGKRNVLSKKYKKVAYHTSSPIIYTADDDYIGGLDEMLAFLIQLPQFRDSQALRKYRVESPLSTFVKGLPVIARNWKSTLPI